MRKNIIGIIIIVFCICGHIFIYNKISSDKNYYSLIDIDTLNNMIETSDDEIVVYFYKPDCSACVAFKPILNKVILGEDALIYAVNGSSDHSKYIQFADEHNIFYTPTIIIFKSGEEVRRHEGMMNEEKLIELLNNKS